MVFSALKHIVFSLSIVITMYIVHNPINDTVKKYYFKYHKYLNVVLLSLALNLHKKNTKSSKNS